MSVILSSRIAELVDFGWELRSQSDTTAALETRRPINWWLFALFLVLFLGFGALLYVTFWVLTSKSHVFLRVLDGDIQVSGDAWLIELQERESEHVIERARQIKEHGFWAVMWPSLIGVVGVLAVWFLVIWLFVQVVR